MANLIDLPSVRAGAHRLADLAELWAWDEGCVSERQILAAIGRLDENDQNFGCDDNDDRNAEGLDEVMNEVGRRAAACGSGYPFALESEGTVLRYLPDDENVRAHVYRYLLLCTRMNMRDDRVHAGLDGAALFEEIGAHVLRCYLGKTRSRSMVFGTATEGKFEEKVNKLCGELREGGCFRNKFKARMDAVDERLDAVAWVPFSDKLRSQLVIFGQCKTGSSWGGQTTDLRPDVFIDRWVDLPYLVEPVRAFCVAEAADRSRRDGMSLYAGLFLDRCRIVDFCAELDAGLIGKIKAWYVSAKKMVVIVKKPIVKGSAKKSKKTRVGRP